MSERLRQTQRVRHHARTDARHTIRVQRFQQVGGGSNAGWVSIPAARADRWREALTAAGGVFAELAPVITAKDWGNTKSAAEKLELYRKLIERQDEMFRIALGIIFDELDIDPSAADRNALVMEKFRETNTEKPDDGKQKALKQYLVDVYRVITLNEEPNLNMTDQIRTISKITRIYAIDPLSNILLWPKRVENMFIDQLADILILLKRDRSILDETITVNTSDFRTMFADVYNAHILSNVTDATQKPLRDGFFIHQNIYLGVMISDSCPSASNCIPTPNPTDKIKNGFWVNFCNYFTSSSADSFTEASSGKLVQNTLFSKIVYDIFKLYSSSETVTASTVYNEIIGKFGAQINQTIRAPPGEDTRPSAAYGIQTNLAAMMRTMAPQQYMFIFHLLYTISKKEAAAAAAAAAAGPSD
jgi:hypothetical protein